MKQNQKIRTNENELVYYKCSFMDHQKLDKTSTTQYFKYHLKRAEIAKKTLITVSRNLDMNDVENWFPVLLEDCIVVDDK